MTQNPPDSRRPRPSPEYRWTDPKALAFLEALAQHGKVAAAARAVGMTRQSAYRLKHRAPMVAEGWALAQEAGRGRRRDALRKATHSSPKGDTLLRQGDVFGEAR